MPIDSRKRWAQTIPRAGLDWIVSLPILDGPLQFANLDATLDFDRLYAGTEL